jgi:hypothetical protein
MNSWLANRKFKRKYNLNPQYLWKNLNSEVKEIIEFVQNKNLSMCSRENLMFTAIVCEFILSTEIKGDFVECGVFRGGNSLVAASVFKSYGQKRKIWLFDTFAGMTEPTKYDVRTRDGTRVMDKYLSRKRNTYTDWAYAPIEEVKANFKEADLLSEEIVFVRGKVETTLENTANLPLKISLLRLDTDWYESTKKELEVLYPKIEKDGFLIVDDYDSFDGSRKATDEYFAAQPFPPFLSSIGNGGRLGQKISSKV